jgi:hypothetical protein
MDANGYIRAYPDYYLDENNAPAFSNGTPSFYSYTMTSSSFSYDIGGNAYSSLLGTVGGGNSGVGSSTSYSGLSTLANAFSWANYGASEISNYPMLSNMYSIGSGIKMATTKGFSAGVSATGQALVALNDMSQNGPPAAKAALTVGVVPFVATGAYVAGPYSLITSYWPYMMTAAGTQAGQKILNNAPEFIDAANPGSELPPNMTRPGLWGYAFGQAINFIRNQF